MLLRTVSDLEFGGVNSFMTLIEEARKRILKSIFQEVSNMENIPMKKVMDEINEGRLVVPKNKIRDVKTTPIGNAVSVKSKVHVGSSTTYTDYNLEIEKAKLAVDLGADVIVDLSTGPELVMFRKELLEIITVPVASSPIFEAVTNARIREGSCSKVTEEDIFKAIENHVKDGVDIIVLHCAFNTGILETLLSDGRVMNKIPRGANFIMEYMLKNECENPLYKRFDDVLDILLEYDVTLAISSAINTKSVFDSADTMEVLEGVVMGSLARRAVKKGVQVMIEAQYSMLNDMIYVDIGGRDALSGEVPLFSTGPMSTEIGLAYSHFTSAIGAAVAGSLGVNLVSCVTPKRGIVNPSIQDIREVTVAASIAKHVANTALNDKNAYARGLKYIDARNHEDLEVQIDLSLDPENARKILDQHPEDMMKNCGKCKGECIFDIVNEEFL